MTVNIKAVADALEKQLAHVEDVGMFAGAAVEAEEVKKVCAHGVDDAIGTKDVGYAGAEMGPFNCLSCVHYEASKEVKEHGLCDHPEVVADPDVPKCKDGNKALVEDQACCNLFHSRDKTE